MSKKLIYLASPATHKDEHVRMLRVVLVTAVGSMLVEQGVHLFGPITESHCYESMNPTLGRCWEFWQEHDLMMIDRCDELWVLKLKGWDISKGVTAEIAYAEEHKKPVKYLELSDFIDLKEIL